MDKLTDREVDVLKMILDGYNSQEIGEKIFRSERTVHDIRENIRGKLGLFTVKRSDFFRAGREYLKRTEIKYYCKQCRALTKNQCHCADPRDIQRAREGLSIRPPK